MSDWITSITVVTGEGVVKVIPDDFTATESVTAKQMLKAASASLGLFGVVLDFTVKVNPMNNARVKNVFSRKLSVSCIMYVTLYL